MSELPKCPYCGEKMRLDADSVHIWMKCDNCLSCGPKETRPDYRNAEFPFEDWNAFWDKCRELAIGAVLRHGALIQQLEAERDALLKVACRYSGCYECKHYHNPSEQPPCLDCGVLGKNWEWRGAPDKEG